MKVVVIQRAGRGPLAARGSASSQSTALPSGGFEAWMMNSATYGSGEEGESPHLLLASAPVVGHRTASAGWTQLFQIFFFYFLHSVAT